MPKFLSIPAGEHFKARLQIYLIFSKALPSDILQITNLLIFHDNRARQEIINIQELIFKQHGTVQYWKERTPIENVKIKFSLNIAFCYFFPESFPKTCWWETEFTLKSVV